LAVPLAELGGERPQTDASLSTSIG
jgi:hypothetical protein